VKRYSSGMYMRLAFAVASHMEPEILLVEADADLQQAADPPAEQGASRVGLRDPAEHLQEGRLAGTVTPDHADHLPGPDLERDIFERSVILQ